MTIKCHQWAVTLTSYWPLVKTATSDNLIGCCLGVVQLCPDRINHGMRDHYCCDIPGDCGSQYVVMSLRRWWVTQWSQCEQQAAHDHDEGKWFSRKTAIILATLHIWGQKEAWDQIFVLCALQLVHTTHSRTWFLIVDWGFCWFFGPIFWMVCCIMSYLGGLAHMIWTNESSVSSLSDQ